MASDEHAPVVYSDGQPYVAKYLRSDLIGPERSEGPFVAPRTHDEERAQER